MTFDPTINLGHLLTMLLIVIGFANQWFRIKAKLDEHDKWLARHDKWIDEHEKCSNKIEEFVRTLGEAVAFIRGALRVGDAAK